MGVRIMTSQLKVDRISPATGSEVTIDGFSGGVPEAPLDGKQYARQDGEWQQVVTGRLITTTRYTSGDIVIPSDAVRGESYITGGGGGGVKTSGSAVHAATGGQGYQYHVFIDDIVGGETMVVTVGDGGVHHPNQGRAGDGGSTVLTYKNLSINAGGGGGGQGGTGSASTGGGAAGVGSITDPDSMLTVVEDRSAVGYGGNGGQNTTGLLDPAYGAGGGSAGPEGGNAGSIYITWYA